MVWFQVDDNVAFHPKVIEAGNGAMGLWVRAGAWCMANLTDGFIPARVAYQLGTKAMCNRLVRAGLFEEALDGYQFHDWFDKQLTKVEIESRRKFERERKAEQRKRHLVPLGQVGQSHTPTQPNPTLSGVGLGTNGDKAPRAAPAQPAAAAVFSFERRTCPLGCAERDGYRPNGTICDHIDHTEHYRNGKAAAQEALNEAKARKATQTQKAVSQ